jgi:hypothetical protein
MSAGSAFAGSRDPLLDKPAAQISVDQPSFSTPDRFDKPDIRDPLSAREPRKPFGLENPHALPRCCEL